MNSIGCWWRCSSPVGSVPRRHPAVKRRDSAPGLGDWQRAAPLSTPRRGWAQLRVLGSQGAPPRTAPGARTTAVQSGACSATAAANRIPGCSSQFRAKCAINGGCSVPQCTGTGESRAAHRDGPGGSSPESGVPPRVSVPTPRPAPGRRRSARLPWRGSRPSPDTARCHRRSRRLPDGPRTRWPLASLGRCGMGRLRCSAGTWRIWTPAAYRGPAVPQGSRVRQLPATQPGDIRRGAHQRCPAQHAKGAQLGVVVVQVRDQHHVRVAPRRRVRPRCQAS